MRWDTLFIIYVVAWGFIGWPVVRSLKRVLKPAGVLGLGVALLLMNLLVFLWQGTWFPPTVDSVGPILPFVLYPTLFLGLLSCYDGISYFISRRIKRAPPDG